VLQNSKYNRAMAWEIGTYKKEYENLKYQIEEYQDFWEWFENKYGQTKAELFDEFDLERALADSTGEKQFNIPAVVCLWAVI
jgi:hypothetical protein